MTRIYARFAMTLLCAGVISMSGCGDSDDGDSSGIRGTAFPRLELDPSTIALTAVDIGEQDERTLVIRNVGGGALIITRLDFSQTLDPAEFSKPEFQLPYRVESEQELLVPITYTPTDAGEDEGLLLLETNDPNAREASVRIVTTKAESELVASPSTLEFFSDEGQTVTKSVDLVNLGAVPVNVTSWRLTDDTDDEFVLKTASMAQEISRDEKVTVQIDYVARGEDDDFGTLIFETDSETQGLISVPLVGAQPSAEIEVLPPSINFGAIEIGDESERSRVVISNQGIQKALKITSIAFTAAIDPINNEQFQLYGVPDFETPLEIQPGATFEFSVSYKPQADGSHGTQIVIASNDADEGFTSIPVTGRVPSKCIQVVPESVSLGAVATNVTSARSNVNVVNCGDLPLTISRFEFDMMNPGFEWAPADGMARENIRLEPLEVFPIEIWFTNAGTPQGMRAETNLTVLSDATDTPEVIIPIDAVGGGQPSCSLLITPSSANFGLVARGRTVSRTLQVINRGTGNCTVTNQEVVAPFDVMLPIPIPGLNAVRFIITQPAMLDVNGQIPPGAIVPIEVTYRPEVFASDQAKLKVSYTDPYEMDPAAASKVAEANLAGIGGNSGISVIPGSLDFGAVTAGECASREERITVYNTGNINLCITGVRVEDDDGMPCNEFLVIDRPEADAEGCIRVTQLRPADMILIYQPDALGSDSCNLVLSSDAENNPELRVPLSGEGVANTMQVDEFVQTSGQTVDVLFVIDNSGSMGEEQANIRDNFDAFISGAQQFRNDYQIGVITTDMQSDEQQGRLQAANDGTRIIRRGPSVEQQFGETVAVGTNGSADEKGLEAAENALKDPLSFDRGLACNGDADCPDQGEGCVEGFCGGFNRGFVREEAALEIVFISDEDDSSTAPLNYYVDFFRSIKGFRNESRFHAHAIVGAVDGRAASCASDLGEASAGRAYVEVAQRTNGIIESICDGNFGNALREIGNQAFGLPVQFFLSRPARRDTIQVSLNGQPQNGGWNYDEDSNSIIFDDGPQPQTRIRVEYDTVCFPRQDQ